MKRRIISSLLCAMVVMSVGAIGASANNHEDNTQTILFEGGGIESATYKDYKLDTSYAYMKCVNTPYAYNACVWACDPKIAEIPDHTDASGGYSYRFTTGVAKYMVNYVYEWMYYNAYILCTPTSEALYHADVKWSPDSI